MTHPLKNGTPAVGAELPPLDLPITHTLIIGGALASRDFTPVHHNAAAARAQGLPDVFMNILTTNGLVSRYVTDWCGPAARVLHIFTKLGGPNLPGDTLRLRGRVTAVTGAEVSVEVVGDNAWGNHVTATLRVLLAELGDAADAV